MLDKDITDAIKKNLPSAVADELKEFIGAAQRTEEILARKSEQLEALAESEKGWKKLVDSKEIELIGLRQKEKDFLASEGVVRDANMRAAIASANLAGAMEVTRLVFQNNIVKRQVFEGGNTSVLHPQGGYQQSMPTSNTTTDTTEG